MPRSELASIRLFPTELITGFWDDLEQGFQETKYLGLEVDDA